MSVESKAVRARNVGGLLLLLSVAACGGGNGSDNQPPLASAGPDQSVHSGDTVTLNGSGSSDPDGDTLSYSWANALAPAGASVQINGTTSSMPSFVPQQVGDYQFTLTVSDGHDHTAQDAVTIHVGAALPPNHAPVATSADVAAVQNQPLAIAVLASDPDGDVLSYTLQGQPQHGTIENFSATQGTFTYVPASNYLGPDSIVVTARDPAGLVATATLAISVNPPNQPPAATISADRSTAYEQSSIFLTVTGSDLDGDAISYTWSQLDGPAGQFFPSTENGQEFWAPAVDSDTPVQLQVQAQDARGAISTAQITIQLLAYHRVGGTISANTTWSSPDGRPLLISSPVTVAKAVTLTIAPGTIVRARSGDESTRTPALTIAGVLNAQGSALAPIFFESVNPLHVEWQGISFSGDTPSATLKYLVIDGADTGIDLASTPSLILSDVLLRDCQTGIGDTAGAQPVTMDHMSFLRNQVGFDIRNQGSSTVSNSLFKDNMIAANGIFTSGNIAFTGNSFLDNETALIAPTDCCGLGKISATQNFWGTTSSAEIGALITDKNDFALFSEIPFQPPLSSANANTGARIDPEIVSSPASN